MPIDLRPRVKNIRALQRELGLKSYTRLHEALAGKRQCGGPLAVRIEAATGGAIRRWELRPDLWDAPAAEDLQRSA